MCCGTNTALYGASSDLMHVYWICFTRQLSLFLHRSTAIVMFLIKVLDSQIYSPRYGVRGCAENGAHHNSNTLMEVIKIYNGRSVSLNNYNNGSHHNYNNGSHQSEL